MFSKTAGLSRRRGRALPQVTPIRAPIRVTPPWPGEKGTPASGKEKKKTQQNQEDGAPWRGRFGAPAVCSVGTDANFCSLREAGGGGKSETISSRQSARRPRCFLTCPAPDCALKGRLLYACLPGPSLPALPRAQVLSPLSFWRQATHARRDAFRGMSGSKATNSKPGRREGSELAEQAPPR